MHLLEEGQKIRAWVDPPPIIRAMPERKRFFAVDVFPYFKDSTFATSLISLGIILLFVLSTVSYQLISYVFLDDVGLPIKKVFVVL